MPRPVVLPLVLCGLLVGAGLGAWCWPRVAAAPMPPPTLAVTAHVPMLTPRVILAAARQPVMIRNDTAQALEIATTPHAPAPRHLRVPPHTSAPLILTTPGLYHIYDAATASVVAYQGGNDVVRTHRGAPQPDLPDEGWIVVPAGQGVPIDAHLVVPAGADLFAPLVVALQVGGTLTIHNHDGDAHNIVTDPADPSGAAFELFGTNDEPVIHGAERGLTFSAPGLYHLYCSMHARVVGQVGGWQVVVPRDATASGFAQHNPMESWVLVTPGRAQ